MWETMVIISKIVITDDLLARGGSLMRRTAAMAITKGRLGDVVGKHLAWSSSGRTSAAEDAGNCDGLVPAGRSACPSLKFPTTTYCYIRYLERCYLAVASYS